MYTIETTTMRFFDNVTNIVRDDMTETITRGSRVSIAAACFSMYAYNELKTQLEGVDELPLKLEGLNVDAVYENFVYQIAGDSLQAGDNESLQDVVERDEKIKHLKKQIEVLQGKIRKEKQLNVQMKVNKELKLLKNALEER